jgi:ubiquinone/menaquinone biosynthesis C-methylase UbiE
MRARITISCKTAVTIGSSFHPGCFMRAEVRRLWGELLNFGFRLLYQEFAWSYDAVSWLVSFGAWRELQRSALPYLQGPRVLEIGHGPGHMLLALHQAGYQVTGIDLSRQMAAISRKRQRKQGITIPQLRAMAQQLPFQPQIFDSVLATFPTEYVAAGETLSAVARVLKENGRFIIVPQARFTGASLPEKVMEWLYQITGQRPGRRNEAGALPAADAFWDQVAHRFARAGFTIAMKILPLARSEVTVIIATKQTNASNPSPRSGIHNSLMKGGSSS